MTCIVGVIKKGKVYVGGDSAGVAEMEIVIRKDVKVFKVGRFVIGCTTSFRMMQLMRYSFKPPPIPDKQDLHEYMCTAFVDALRECFKEGGYLTKENEAESGGEMLIGIKGRLFFLGDDFQVGEGRDNYHSVGCGAVYAIGALDVLDELNLTGYETVTKALTVAAYRSGGVRPPFIMEST